MTIIPLKLADHREGTRDIALLSPLVAPAKQDHKNLTALDKIDAIPWTVIDPHFRHAVVYRSRITRIAERQTADASGDTGARLTVA